WSVFITSVYGRRKRINEFIGARHGAPTVGPMLRDCRVKHGGHWKFVSVPFDIFAYCSSNGFQHFRLLGMKQRRIPDRGVVHDIEEFVGRRQLPGLWDFHYDGVREAGVPQELFRFRRSTKPEKWRPRRDSDIQVTVLLDRRENNSES